MAGASPEERQGPRASRQPPPCDPSPRILPPPRTKKKLDYDFTRTCYKELLGFTTIQSPNYHRFQEYDFTPLLHDKTLDLRKVSEHPYAEARQFAVAFPGKSTSLSPTIHRIRNLSQLVQEFLGWQFSTDHVGQAQA